MRAALPLITLDYPWDAGDGPARCGTISISLICSQRGRVSTAASGSGPNRLVFREPLRKDRERDRPPSAFVAVVQTLDRGREKDPQQQHRACGLEKEHWQAGQ